MKAKYNIDEDKALLFEVFYGDINLADLEDIVRHQMQNPAFNDVKKVISDTRGANVIISAHQLNDYVNGLKEYLSKVKIRWAIIVDDPRTAALSILIKKDSFFKNRVEVFSTFEAAVHCLQLALSQYEVEQFEYTPVE
ncbi:hypothetical protein [Labilibacter marinus]|uniref:hypothetical protein n=1 Tax=Labilibacter marinus TaxID=1477105 RepID=UPI0009500753|nr:hypothetical protein [Labilibacter marinus]